MILISVPPSAAPTLISDAVNVTEAIGLAATATPTEVPITAGIALHTADHAPVQLIGLDYLGETPIGLRADGRALITWDSSGLVTSIAIPTLIANALTIDSAHGLIYLSGVPSSTP